MFYYSPASKLYYSVFLGKYFQCDSSNSSSSTPFHEVAPPVPVDDAPYTCGQQLEGIQTPAPTSSGLKTASTVSLSMKLPAKKKAPISFGLKATTTSSKKLETVGSTTSDATASSAAFDAGAAPVGMTRRSAQDIAKWSQLQRKTKLEEKQQPIKPGGVANLPFDSVSVPTKTPDKTATQVSKCPEPVAAPSVIDALANTAVEVPICLLCRRKFNSMEVLRKHETMSKLHLENLAKARQDKQVVAAEYRERDRAAVAAHDKRERAAASQEAEAKRRRLAESATNSAPTQEVKATAALEQGIGGKMLKMMGWKSGEGLGKRGTGITAPISASTGGGSSSSSAGLGSRSVQPVNIPESASYKERVQAFTRARYEATGAKEQ